MQYMTEEFLNADINVIYDMNAMRKSQRATLREMARKKGAKTVVVWFQMDSETAFNRIKYVTDVNLMTIRYGILS
jgi:predicted kinase